MMKEASPEERLFKIIKEGKKTPDENILKLKSGPKPGGWLLSWFKKDPLPVGSGSSLKIFGAQFKNIDINSLNKILFCILGVLMMVVFYTALIKKIASPALIPPRANTEIWVNGKKPEAFKPITAYLGEVDKRDIFHPIAPPAPPQTEVKPQPKPEINANELIKDLKLSGIYRGKDSEAIIEDKTSKKIYYVKTGDKVNNLRVKNILEDRVIFEAGEKEIELL